MVCQVYYYPSQGRSYLSSDGLTFDVIDALSAKMAGNFGIRATVTVGN